MGSADIGGRDHPLVRPVAFEELAEVAAIEEAVFPQPIPWVDLAQLWLEPATCYLGIRQQDRLVAYFGFQVRGATAHVISNATHPDFRRRGLATLLLRQGAVHARRRGARWFLGAVRASNVVQLALLLKQGWRVIGTCAAFFDDGESAFVVWALI